MAINPDFAPTFLDIAGLPVPADMQGRSLVPLLKGERPADWRTSWYYRYYHDPGDHNTRAHYGVRTDTHKLIYFWKKDQWEMYDLVEGPGRAAQPLQRSGAEGDCRQAEDRTLPPEEGSQGRRPIRQRTAAPGRGRATRGQAQAVVI